MTRSLCALVVGAVMACTATRAAHETEPPVHVFAPPAPEEPPTLRIGIEVPLAVSADVIAGVRAWERVTLGWRRWEIVPMAFANATIVQARLADTPCPNSITTAGCSVAVGGLAWDRAPWGKMYLIEGKYENAATLITMHEIGHALGLSHEEGTIMQSPLTMDLWSRAWSCPDAVTLRRFAALTGFTPTPCDSTAAGVFAPVNEPMRGTVGLLFATDHNQ